MEKLGNIDLDELDDLKRKLKGCGYKITDDALDMIQKLENQMVTLVLNHNHYVQWAVEEIKKRDKSISDYSWTVNPDRMGGQFTQDEIDRSRNGGW
jgi:hypothetical protein